MKKLVLTCCYAAILLLLATSSHPVCAASSTTLVAYFSATGNTAPLARYTSDILGADLFEIIPEQPYTSADLAYYTGGRCDQEQADSSVRPAIKNTVANMAQYDTVIIGHPIWHGQAPRIISTFLESYDFSGKKLVTFCTSQSSGLGSSAQNLHGLVNENVTWLTSRRFPASGTTRDDIQAWLDEIGLKKTEEIDSEIYMKIDCTLWKIRLDHTQAAEELKNLLNEKPISISMTGNRFEQYGELGRSLTTTNESITAEAGDVLLYKGDTLCVFYGNNTYSYTRIGKIQDVRTDELTALLSNGNKTITWYSTPPSTVHTPVNVEEKKTTCNEDGYTAGTKCSVCGEILSGCEVVKAPGHVSVAVEEKKASCTEDGLTAGTKCSTCGEILSGCEVVKASGHLSVILEEKKATCTENGLTAGTKCSVCGEVLEKQIVIPATGHTERHVDQRAATCTQDGCTDGIVCAVCGEVLTAQTIIPALGHKPMTLEGKAATCLENGLTDGQKCSVCGEILIPQKIIGATGHVSVVEKGKMATCTEEGITDGVRCSICGTIITAQNPIPPIGHTEISISGKAPTETESGLSEGKKCAICGKIIVPQKEIPKLEGKASDGTSVGAGSSKAVAEAAIGAAVSDEGPAGTKFNLLKAQMKKATKNSITIKWKSLAGASYVIYGNACGKGKKFKKIREVRGTSFKQNGLKKGKYYKYLVMAVRDGKVVSTSKTLHIATAGGKVGNNSKVILKKKRLALKKGKTRKLKATLKKGKLVVKKHRKISWESSNPSVATVNSSGKVKALSKGKAVIYAYAQNGKYAKCVVTVR